MSAADLASVVLAVVGIVAVALALLIGIGGLAGQPDAEARLEDLPIYVMVAMIAAMLWFSVNPDAARWLVTTVLAL